MLLLLLRPLLLIFQTGSKLKTLLVLRIKAAPKGWLFCYLKRRKDISLILRGSLIANTKLIEFFGMIALLIVFEFLNLLLHPLLEYITHHTPVFTLLALVCVSLLLVPMHLKIEKLAAHKLVEKNKLVRLATAKKTMEEVENENN